MIVLHATVERDTGRPVRVRLRGCPHCRRPLVLDHCGGPDGEPDYAAVLFAQQLHVVNCPG